MKQRTRIPAAATPQEICGWAKGANAAAVAGLRQLVGDGASRDLLGRVAETLRRMEAQVSSLKCDLAGWLQRTDGGAGAGEALRDQLGMTNQGAKHLSQVARRLEEMPNTRSKLQAGEITLVNAAALAAAAEECGAKRVDENEGLLAEAARANPDDYHLRDWYDDGPTDIDNLASLCGPHHRELQEHNLELAKSGNRWQTRPRPGPPPPPPPVRRPTQPPIRAGPP